MYFSVEQKKQQVKMYVIKNVAQNWWAGEKWALHMELPARRDGIVIIV